jgi:hypothetical protein
MRRRICLIVLLLALPTLACNLGALEAWGDLADTARAIWAAVWTTPKPDYTAVSIFCSDGVKTTYGDPPEAYVDEIISSTEEIAAAWGISPPYSETFTLGTHYDKPDGSGRTMAPFQFTNPYSDVHGVPYGAPVTGLCLEFQSVDFDGTPVPLLADGYQVADYVLPTTTPQAGYAECPSGITPTPLPTDTPTPAPGDAYESDDPPDNSDIAIDEVQNRTLEPTGDVDVVHLWVWAGLRLSVETHSLGGNASTSVEIQTCDGLKADTDGGTAYIQWTSLCDEVIIITITSANAYYGPGETYTLETKQLP